MSQERLEVGQLIPTSATAPSNAGIYSPSQGVLGFTASSITVTDPITGVSTNVVTGANHAAEHAAMGGSLVDNFREGISMSTIVRNVSNVLQYVVLPSGIVDIDLTYQNSSGDAGNIKIVPEAFGATDAAARMANDDTHYEIIAGETRTLKFSPLTQPTALWIKSTSALTTGSNALHIRERGELVLPEMGSGYSSKLRAYYNCQQASPDLVLKDLSGLNATIAFEAGLSAAAAWAAPGWLTLPALSGGSKTYPIVPAATFNSWFNFGSGDSLLLHASLDVTPSGGNIAIFGSGNAVSGASRGFKFRMTAAGLLQGAFYCTNGISLFTTNPVGSISTGPHSAAIYIDGQAKTCTIYIDGLVDSLGFSLATADNFDTTIGMLIGGEPSGTVGSTHTGPAGIYRNIQFYSWKASAPAIADVHAIAARLHSTLGPLLASELA